MPLIDITSPRHLSKAVNAVKVTTPFLLDTFFKTKEFAGAKTVDVEIKTAKDKRAQFVSDSQEALTVAGDTSILKTVTIPTTYEQKIFNQDDLSKFLPYDSSYVSVDEQNAFINENILSEVATLKQRVITRREDMAAQSLYTGILTVSQANIAFSIDYGYATNQNKITRTSTLKWDAGSTAKILTDFRLAKTLARKKGYNIDTCVMSGDALEAFLQDVNVLKALDNNNFRTGALDLTKYANSDANYIGNILGVSIFEYANEYVDEAGDTQLMIPTDKVLFGASNNSNKISYAPIRRFVNGKVQTVSTGDMYLTNETAKDERSVAWKLEQKSLPIIQDPNAFVVFTVV